MSVIDSFYMPHSAQSCRIMPVSEHSPSKSSENGTVSKMENGTEIGFSWHDWSPPDAHGPLGSITFRFHFCGAEMS
jgi:hypothetical protein